MEVSSFPSAPGVFLCCGSEFEQGADIGRSHGGDRRDAALGVHGDLRKPDIGLRRENAGEGQGQRKVCGAVERPRGRCVARDGHGPRCCEFVSLQGVIDFPGGRACSGGFGVDRREHVAGSEIRQIGGQRHLLPCVPCGLLQQDVESSRTLVVVERSGDAVRVGGCCGPDFEALGAVGKIVPCGGPVAGLPMAGVGFDACLALQEDGILFGPLGRGQRLEQKTRFNCFRCHKIKRLKGLLVVVQNEFVLLVYSDSDTLVAKSGVVPSIGFVSIGIDVEHRRISYCRELEV